MTIQYNPLMPDQSENPYPIYAAARAESPVLYSEALGLWIITRYDDVVAVLKDHERFSSMNSLTALPMAPEAQAVIDQGYPELATLVDNDPPGQTRLRNLINKAFTPRIVAKLEPTIYQIAHDLVDSFVHTGNADLISQFAFRLPAIVIADLLGIPRADVDNCRRWGDARVSLMSPGNFSTEQQVAFAHDYLQFQQYLMALLEERRTNPRDDLLSSLVQISSEDDTRASMIELIHMTIQLFNAGHETTTGLIGNAVALLLRHPEQMAAIRSNPGLAASIVEEVLRLDTPVLGLFRITTQDVELGGVTIPQGSQVQVLYASANHDTAIFPEPDHFDIQRHNAQQHVSFGRGVHFCVGAALARVEGHIALEVLLERLPNLRLHADKPPVRKPHIFLRGFEHLYLEWDALSTAAAAHPEYA